MTLLRTLADMVIGNRVTHGHGLRVVEHRGCPKLFAPATAEPGLIQGLNNVYWFTPMIMTQRDFKIPHNPSLFA